MSSEGLFDPPADIRQRVTRGAVHTGAAQAVRLVTQFGSAVILTRLLAPADVGVMAMAWPVIAFAQLFQDMGLSQALVQRPRIELEDVNSLFWINFVVGAVLVVALVVAGPFVGAFYHDGKVGTLTSALGLLVAVSSQSSLPYSILTRRMAFGQLALLDAVGAAAGLAASVAWAVAAPSYWALYIGTLVTALVPTIGMWLMAGWRPRPPRLAGEWRALLNFGAGLTGFNFANYFARNLGNILIGRFDGDAMLGLYDRAYRLLLFPLQQVNNPLARVMVPALARLVSDPPRYRSAFLRTLGQMLLVTLPGVAFMAGTADDFVPFLLGEQWRGVAPIFKALSLAGLLQPLNNPSGWLFMSQGRSGDFMRWGIFSAVICTIAYVAGLPFGPFGVAAAYAASEYVRTPILWWYLGRTGPIGSRDVTRTALPHVAGAAASLFFLWWMPPLPGVPTAIRLVIDAPLSYLISLLVIIAFPAGRETVAGSLSLVAGVLDRFLPGLLRRTRPGA